MYNEANSGLTDDHISCIAIDNDGNLWAGTVAGGLNKFNEQTQTWQNYTSGASGLLRGINCIEVDKSNNIWLGVRSGLVKFDGKDEWNVYATDNSGLINNYVRCIAIDSSNNIRAGTNKGLCKFDGKEWTNYANDNGAINGMIYFIAADNDANKWLVTGKGLYQFNTAWTNHTVDNIGFSTSINCVIVDKHGNKYCSTSLNGYSKFDDAGWTNYTIASTGLPSNNIYCMAIDNKNNIWFATDAGIARFGKQAELLK